MLAATAPVATASPDALLADPRLWRATSLGRSSSPCLASGFAALDAELPGGGWPTRMLSEILQPEPGLCEWRLLGPALGRLLQPETGDSRLGGSARRRAAPPRVQRQLLLINPPHRPHLPGLRAQGIAPSQLVWIDPADALQALWVTEQTIKANATAAILAWLPTARPAQIRRLQAAALASAAPVFLFRPLAAQTQSSAAPLRLLLSPGADWTLQLQILKRRGPAHAGALQLSALPAELAALLPARLLRPAAQPTHEVEHEFAQQFIHQSHAALARPARALGLI